MRSCAVFAGCIRIWLGPSSGCSCEPRRGSSFAQNRIQPDVELVTITERQSLIVVNRAVFGKLPGIQIVPLDGRRAFLALEPGRGMADLELAVLDRLENAAVAPPERQALARLRTELRDMAARPDAALPRQDHHHLERLSRRRQS